MNIIYRIYDGYGLAYVGQTAQPIDRRLHGHFFAKPTMRKLDPRSVTKVEYAVCKTRADMNLYEIYYIEKLKPPFNIADKHGDALTVDLPELEFTQHECKLLEKWRAAIDEKEFRENEAKEQKVHAALRAGELRRQFRLGEIGEERYFDEMDEVRRFL
jgi:excinuclease UvrABC nuclease subunit